MLACEPLGSGHSHCALIIQLCDDLPLPLNGAALVRLTCTGSSSSSGSTCQHVGICSAYSQTCTSASPGPHDVLDTLLCNAHACLSSPPSKSLRHHLTFRHPGTSPNTSARQAQPSSPHTLSSCTAVVHVQQCRCTLHPHLKHPVHQSLDFIPCRLHSNCLRGAASIIMRTAGLVIASACVAQHGSSTRVVLVFLGVSGICRCPDLLLMLLAER